jgi:hypothetical protein
VIGIDDWVTEMGEEKSLKNYRFFKLLFSSFADEICEMHGLI